MEKARNIIFTLELIFGRMLTLKLVCLITLIFLVGVNSYSQTEPKKIFTSTYNSNAKDCCRLSVQYLIKKDYRKAELYLIKALKYDPLYIEARMRLANIYCETGKFELGEEQYLEVMESEPEYPYVYYNYANKSFNIKKYQKAIDNYEKFLEFDSLDNHYEKLALRNLELVKFRKNAYENPVPFNPENIGPGINSNLDEYWPVLTADDQTLYFTRKLYNPQQPHYKFNEDIYYSELDKNGEWSAAQPAPGNLNSPDNEGAILISPDGR